MKLYNILEEIILEYKRLLFESVSKDQIYNSLDDHKRIKIYYQGEKEQRPEVRFIDVYAYGVSKAGNEVIRVYQAFGTTTTNIGWKLMRLDRITRWEPTGFRFSEKSLDNDPTIPKRNTSGDDSMATVYRVARFNTKPDVKQPTKPIEKQVEKPINEPLNKQDNGDNEIDMDVKDKTPSTYND